MIKIPKFLHDILGEESHSLSIFLIAFMTTVMMVVLGIVDSAVFLKSGWIRGGIGFLLIADIFAGTVANFTSGTNNYYAKRPLNRWIFIAIHVQPILIAWLLSGNMLSAALVWLFTLLSAIVVNLMTRKMFQREVAGALMCFGIFLSILLYQDAPITYLALSVFFVIKVVFSFSVDHEMRCSNDSAAEKG